MNHPATSRVAALLGAASLSTVLSELRLVSSERGLTDGWRSATIPQRGATRLGLSFRPRQCEDLSLDPRATLTLLLDYPFEVIRLGAYWDRIRPNPNTCDHHELDWQLDAAESQGKKAIVNLGAIKSFGYPEYFVPPHLLKRPLPEGQLITPDSHPQLLDDAVAHLCELVERYGDRESIIAWQVEHDAVDPLGMEHSWRLSRDFVQHEVAAVRRVDDSRPVLLNGFLPMSSPVTAHQWWRTRDQGDSVDVALALGDAVGIDSYPRHALRAFGTRSLYLDGAEGWLPRRRRSGVLRRLASSGRQLIITEGQAEPWEAVTVPPDPAGQTAASCPPERLIENYAQWKAWAQDAGIELDTYLFWGAEYWILRAQGGDTSYLQAFARVLEASDHRSPR